MANFLNFVGEDYEVGMGLEEFSVPENWENIITRFVIELEVNLKKS